MTRITVATQPAYEVVVEPGVLARAADELARLVRNGRMIVVADANVRAHVGTLEASLATAGIRVERIDVPSGEASKSWAELARLVDALLTLEVERSETIVAIGGGVIGDLTGFAASIVKRGCRHVQLPTTLLAQVDSSVGGKTAINVSAGKNLVGSFHQPALVLVDPLLLGTLEPRQLRAGYAEVVKYGLIDDPVFFAWCEAHGAELLGGDVALRAQAIAHSVAAKARIVAADEHETSGTRALLNLGHTFAHALEAATGFSDRLLHGEAVASGMALAFRLSAELGLCPSDDAARVAAHLAAVGLPTGHDGITDLDGAALVALMANDKKRSGGRVPLLLARGIGQTFLTDAVDLARVARFLDADRG